MIPILLILGTICFVSAYYLYKNPTKKITKNKIENSLIDENTQKGKAFEEYVLDLFLNESQVELTSRVSDYYKNGKYAQDNKNPDLKFIYKNIPFAIECKYRSNFHKQNTITWAKEHQIKNYNEFEKANKTKVFIAIGIGGNPTQPQEFYIVPLFRLTKSFATTEYIEEFKINSIKEFLEKIE